jgi:hypothetical protein
MARPYVFAQVDEKSLCHFDNPRNPTSRLDRKKHQGTDFRVLTLSD